MNKYPETVHAEELGKFINDINPSLHCGAHIVNGIILKVVTRLLLLCNHKGVPTLW